MRDDLNSYLLAPTIAKLRPFRWKVFQALRVEGQNDAQFEQVGVAPEAFVRYCARNASALAGAVKMVPEDNEAMTGSYVMVDSLGRFFDNTLGRHSYSSPILEVGVEQALRQVSCSFQKFIDREGLYSARVEPVSLVA